jgi:mannosyl-oligosaccharide alpha-1,3-glucosidase
MQVPEDDEGFKMDNQVYLGDTGILIHPVVHQGEDKVDVYLGENEVCPSLFLTHIDLL